MTKRRKRFGKKKAQFSGRKEKKKTGPKKEIETPPAVKGEEREISRKKKSDWGTGKLAARGMRLGVGVNPISEKIPLKNVWGGGGAKATKKMDPFGENLNQGK